MLRQTRLVVKQQRVRISEVTLGCPPSAPSRDRFFFFLGASASPPDGAAPDVPATLSR